MSMRVKWCKKLKMLIEDDERMGQKRVKENKSHQRSDLKANVVIAPAINDN